MTLQRQKCPLVLSDEHKVRFNLQQYKTEKGEPAMPKSLIYCNKSDILIRTFNNFFLIFVLKFIQKALVASS